MKKKHEHVCSTCGVAVIACGRPGTGTVFWKHATGGRGRLSCRRPPVVVSAEEYGRQLEMILAAAKNAAGQ